MNPVEFNQANCTFGAPQEFTEGQVMTIPAFKGRILGGSVDGVDVVVVAWKPDAEEVESIVAGAPIFLTVLGGLPPHFLTTDFSVATKPA